MNETIQRGLLETEINVLIGQLQKSGFNTLSLDSSPNKDGSLSHLSLTDLSAMKRELRDLLRTIGGGREG